jgi:RNA-directed DNA polymerase
MRRSIIGMEEVASWLTLTEAFAKAARGRRQTREVLEFERRFDDEIWSLRESILDGSIVDEPIRQFFILDPKLRRIRAPSFRSRVFHHALMAQVGPALDGQLIDDTFACRRGKGSLAAVKRAQHFSRRFPWFVKMDIRSYFDSIDHGILRGQLRRRLKPGPALDLCDGIIDKGSIEPGRGLPIGFLTSQYFANSYLAPIDRLIANDPRARGLVRYMDDIVAWTTTKDDALALLKDVVTTAGQELGLSVKKNVIVQHTGRGLPFCGFRIFPGMIRLGDRRKKLFRVRRRYFENAYSDGRIDAAELCRRIEHVLALTAHADATG